MTLEEIKLQRLSGQHLLKSADTQSVIKDLCGVQAQFLTHALHALTLRTDSLDASALVKSWTNRGTMHLFSQEDLPLFLHQDRSHRLRPVDTMESDAYLSASRKAYFASLILAAVASGTEDREDLKRLCTVNGMTDAESESIFNPWGGLLRALCETGKLCYKVQQKKAFQLCPDFEPMSRQAAQIELLCRYFSTFGPATIKDAAYFFGWPQSQIKTLLNHLPLESFSVENRIYYHTVAALVEQELPSCLFLAGFDQLMLGYEKTESLFLPQGYLRDIFTLAGIVRPAVLIDGTVSGFWNLKNGKLLVSAFEEKDQDLIRAAAETFWPNLNDICITKTNR